VPGASPTGSCSVACKPSSVACGRRRILGRVADGAAGEGHGGVPYPVKRGLLWLVKHTVNRVSVPLARSGHGPFALVRHVGRRSGRTYAAPLAVARVPDGFVIELTYRPDVDWYRNITAAGGRGLPSRIGPAAGDQLGVPAQQGSQ
jgi:hypothetical protein